MRITRHAVAPDDRTPFHEAMRPTLRAAGSGDERFRASGLAVADADALVPHLLDFAHRPRAREAIEAMLGERLGAPPEPGLWRVVRAIAPLVHAPTERPWGFARMASYVAPPAAGTPHAGGDAALRTLVLCYLAAFGQASRQDFAQVATLRRVEVRLAFEAFADALVVLEGPDGATLSSTPTSPATPSPTTATSCTPTPSPSPTPNVRS